ncbi:MAG: hypothetical protein IJS26_01550 [Alphaproteobacteria bacterium]|nr:hypothetical protein [Alphaproteobacteria bacterium]
MLYTVLLGVFIGLLFVLLFVSSKLERHVDIKIINTVFLVCSVLVGAFAGYSFTMETVNPRGFNLLGYALLFLFVLIVRGAYLPKTIRSDKIYELSEICSAIMRGPEEQRTIAGSIQEGRYKFYVYVRITPEQEALLAAQGYFDAKTSSNKALKVCLKSRTSTINNGAFYDAEMHLAE